MSFIFHMPHGWPRYLFWGMSKCSFNVGFSMDFLWRICSILNWFLLILQTANSSTKKFGGWLVLKFFWSIFVVSLILRWLPRWRTYKDRHKWCKKSISKLWWPKHALKCLNISVFYQSSNFGWTWLIYLKIWPISYTYENFHMTYKKAPKFTLSKLNFWLYQQKLNFIDNHIVFSHKVLNK